MQIFPGPCVNIGTHTHTHTHALLPQWGQPLNCSGTEHITRSPLAVISTVVPTAVPPQTCQPASQPVADQLPPATHVVRVHSGSQFPTTQLNNHIMSDCFYFLHYCSGPQTAAGSPSVNCFVFV